MSLARSLLQAWSDPLVLLSSSASALPHPAQSTIFNKIQEMQQYSKSLKDGLDVLSSKVCKRRLQGLCSENKKLFSFTVQILMIQNVSLKWFFPASVCVQMGSSAQAITSLPYRGGTNLGHDKITKLINFNFLLSCLRRDSHKIDSFLKVLRCRAAKVQPEMCWRVGVQPDSVGRLFWKLVLPIELYMVLYSYLLNSFGTRG